MQIMHPLFNQCTQNNVYMRLIPNRDKSWTIRPQQGLIRKNEHQIFVLKFRPRAASIVVERCELGLNYRRRGAAAASLELPIVGGNASAELCLENNGVMFLPPTCRFNSTAKGFEMVNLTASRVHYEWKIPFEAAQLLGVDMVRSYMEPFEKRYAGAELLTIFMLYIIDSL